MAINIREDESIKGIKVNEIQIKISQLADDTTLFLNDIVSVKKSSYSFGIICKNIRLKIKSFKN